MTIQELGTIMEQGAPVKIILLNNNFLGNVRQWQEMFFAHRYSFTPMDNPDYELISKGYGIPAKTAWWLFPTYFVREILAIVNEDLGLLRPKSP